MKRYRRPAAKRKRARSNLQAVLASLAAGHLFSNKKATKKAMNAINLTMAAILAAATLLMTARDTSTEQETETFSAAPSCSTDRYGPIDPFDELEIAPLVPASYRATETPRTAYQPPGDRTRRIKRNDGKGCFLKRFFQRFRERRAQRKEKRTERRQARGGNQRPRRERH